jgi:hypothetical protein
MFIVWSYTRFLFLALIGNPTWLPGPIMCSWLVEILKIFHKSGRIPSSEHFWQVWLKSVQRFQRRRVKCEKLTDGQRTLTHDKSSHDLWPGELKTIILNGFLQKLVLLFQKRAFPYYIWILIMSPLRTKGDILF